MDPQGGLGDSRNGWLPKPWKVGSRLHQSRFLQLQAHFAVIHFFNLVYSRASARSRSHSLFRKSAYATEISRKHSESLKNCATTGWKKGRFAACLKITPLPRPSRDFGHTHTPGEPSLWGDEPDFYYFAVAPLVERFDIEPFPDFSAK